MTNLLLVRVCYSRTSQVPILNLILPKGLLLEEGSPEELLEGSPEELLEGSPEELLEGSLRVLLVVSRKLQELLVKVNLQGLLLEESSLVGQLKGRLQVLLQVMPEDRLQVLLRVLPEECLPRGKLEHCFKGLLHLKRIPKRYLTKSLKMWLEEWLDFPGGILGDCPKGKR